MTLPLHLNITQGDQRWEGDVPPVTVPPSDPLAPTHRVMTDFELGRNNRRNMPMVWVFDDNNVVLTKEWQMFLVAINFGMRDNNISHIIGDGVAYCNKTGTGGNAHRADYIMMDNLDNPLPQTDKTRTSGDALIRYVDGAVLFLDGNHPPPLKPGAVHPQSTAEAKQSYDRYLYNPQTHPAYFHACTTTGNDNHAHPWPNGALYPWYKNGTTPVTWFYHVSDFPVLYPPRQWTDNTPTLAEL